MNISKKDKILFKAPIVKASVIRVSGDGKSFTIRARVKLEDVTDVVKYTPRKKSQKELALAAQSSVTPTDSE